MIDGRALAAGVVLMLNAALLGHGPLRRAVADEELAGPAIWLIAGQSNANGQTDTLTTEPPGLPLSDVRYWGVDVLTDPADPTAPVDLDVEPYSPTVTPIGCELQLGADLNAAGHNVAIIKYAAGSTGIFNHWWPWQGDHPSEDLKGMLSSCIASVRAFIDALIVEDSTREPYLAGVVWNQWETDGEGVAGFVYSAEYEKAQLRIIDRFRAEFHPDLPIYVTAVSPDYAGGNHATNVAACLAGKAAAVGARSNCLLISTTGVPLKVDGVHFTVDGQQTIGGRTEDNRLPDPQYAGNPDVRRVALYTSRAAANAAASDAGGVDVFQGPVDELWAIEASDGNHFVSAADWVPAATNQDLKACLWFPWSITAATPGDLAMVDNPEVRAALMTGHWHIPFTFGFDDNNAAIRYLLNFSSNNRVAFLSNGRAQVRAGASSALSSGLTFAVDDTGVIEVDFTGSTNNVLVYVNDVLVATLSQANDFSTATQELEIGHAAWDSATQWLGTIELPIVGAYSP